MTTDDDIGMGGDEEARSLPARLYGLVMGSPVLAGFLFGFIILLAVTLMFAGGSSATVRQPAPIVAQVTSEDAQAAAATPETTTAAATTAEPQKPAVLDDKSAPSATVPVVADAALVITDVGLSRRISDAVIRQLPTNVTVAISPYATNLPASIAAYKSAGNDVWLQLAVRSRQAGIDAGPLALSSALANNENQTYLQQQLSQAGGGYVGLYVPDDGDITTNGDAWKAMALDLIGKNLMILDATPAKVATELYMPQDASNISAYLKADAIVPGDQGPAALKAALDATVSTILRERQAIIVIDHPTTLAITQVSEWLKTLRGQGIELVPASKFTGLKP